MTRAISDLASLAGLATLAVWSRSCSCDFAATPDGKTVCVATGYAIIPVSTATNKPGKPIPTRVETPDGIVIAP